ncbi:MAG: TetR/AcrR family transcriptional regulator [Alphaproteobacteria bacterium]|nr:TetR/AcrR family transcriptional regulator [Alphaproteobacteria bacterium]
MPLSAEHKARTRRAIVEAAARLFRRHGYEATGIDDIMAAAGLTRGGFYAHFPSKDALFAEVVRDTHGFIRQMRARKAADRRGLGREGLKVIADYLHPRHLPEVGPGCTLAALPGDVARGGVAAQLAYANAFYALAGEIGRGLPRARTLDRRATAAAILCVGAVALARAGTGAPGFARHVLGAAEGEVRRLLRPKPAIRRKPRRRRRVTPPVGPARRRSS